MLAVIRLLSDPRDRWWHVISTRNPFRLGIRLLQIAHGAPGAIHSAPRTRYWGRAILSK